MLCADEWSPETRLIYLAKEYQNPIMQLPYKLI